jgi:hypothetical protein
VAAFPTNWRFPVFPQSSIAPDFGFLPTQQFGSSVKASLTALMDYFHIIKSCLLALALLVFFTYRFFTRLLFAARVDPQVHEPGQLPEHSPIQEPAPATMHGATCFPTAQPTCFRISGVPRDWSKNDLLDALRTTDKSITDKTYQLALHPACSSSTQTALLSLDTCTEYFSSLERNTEKYVFVSRADDSSKVQLRVDNHFYDLTPLNTPRGEIVAELVLPLSDLGLNVKVIVVWWQLLVSQATRSDPGEVVLLGKCGSRTYCLMTLRGSASCHTGITATLLETIGRRAGY